MSYNSWMHRKASQMRRMTAEERRERKHARIAHKKKIQQGNEGFNPLRGIVGFFNSLKNIRNKGEHNASQHKAGKTQNRKAQKRG